MGRGAHIVPDCAEILFTGPRLARAASKAKPLSTLLGAIELDPLTVADDAHFLARIAAEANVPEPIRSRLA